MSERTITWWLDDGVLHALGAASPITVMEVEALALEDEGTDAILGCSLVRIARKAVKRLPVLLIRCAEPAEAL